MKTFPLRVLAPERTFFDGACTSLTVPSIDGIYGLMAQHEDIVLAIVPGTSRSGATIIGGMLCGCSRTAAAEFTFFLAIPVMFGWGVLKLMFGIMRQMNRWR